MWSNIDSLKQMLMSCNPNGRYFTNIITYLMCKSEVISFVIYTLGIGLFFYLFQRFFSEEIKNKWMCFLLIGLLLLFTPRYFYVHIYNWISGFTNYVISLIFTFIYILYCFPLFEKKPIRSNGVLGILFLLIGFLGSLCVENITIYNIGFGLFVITFTYLTQRKVFISNISYFIGSLAGTLFMMSDSNYKHIMESGDDIAFRSFEFSITDIYFKIYREIIVNYARPYFCLHLCICLSIVILTFRKYGEINKYPKYCFPSIIVILSYSVFSFVVTNGEELAVLTSAYRIRAIETAFTFVYLISLIYMISILFESGKRIRALIYLLSTVVTIAPFVVVNSITARCFYATFIFWCLLTFEFTIPVVNKMNFSYTELARKGSFVLIVLVLGLNLYMDISNKFVDKIRIKYIHEQLEEDVKQVECIKLPYQKNVFDPITLFSENDLFLYKNGVKYSYTELYCMTNDIDVKILNKQINYIDMIDYTIKLSE